MTLCNLLQTSLLNENNEDPVMFNNQKVKLRATKPCPASSSKERGW